jgi:hypothetical protein
LEEPARLSRDEKRERYEARRIARRDARAELASERAAGLWTDPALLEGNIAPDNLDDLDEVERGR